MTDFKIKFGQILLKIQLYNCYKVKLHFKKKSLRNLYTNLQKHLQFMPSTILSLHPNTLYQEPIL